MNFVNSLKEELAQYHLLKHPFYLDWVEGTLPKANLKNYASQYYHHVAAFPRYISALHSLCAIPENRQVLLENLNEEEGMGEGHSSHPDLWMDFVGGLGLKKEEVQHTEACESIKKLISTFFTHCRGSYGEGLSALYSYEYQVPEVAETKIKGLKEHYGITDEKTLLFFLVHKTADIEHREAIEALLEKLGLEEQEKARASAVEVARALWDFLTEMHTVKFAA